MGPPLPAIPSFGERLFDVLGNVGANIGQGLQQRAEGRRVQQTMQTLLDPNTSPLQKVVALSSAPESFKKSTSPVWAALLGPQAQAEAQTNVLQNFLDGGVGASPFSAPSINQGAMSGVPFQQPVRGQMQPVSGPMQPNAVNIAPNMNAAAPTFQRQAPSASVQKPHDPNDLTTWSDRDINVGASVDSPLKGFFQNEQQRRRTLEERGVKAQEREEEKEFQRERALFSSNEPELREVGKQLQNLKVEDARFKRLETLFSDPSKFPSSITTALFTDKEGQLRPIASALLSPEAQEAVKLIQDNLSGAKDTFGARVTNFDVSNYLKRLPSLLNTPEGRTRVLRDLRMINEMNREYSNGILDIIERKGGSDKISFTSAERLWNKENQERINKLTEEFVNPKNEGFKSFPDAKKYLGQKLLNEATGEVFISDGNQWKPFSQGNQ